MSNEKIVTVLGRYRDSIYYDPDWGCWRNVARGDRVVAFINRLTVPSGHGAGQPLTLREWQEDFVRDVYEACDENGRRIARDAILSMGRKNGKTALIAALVLVHLVGPEMVANGEIYSGANDREQAAIVFKFVAQYVRAEPELDAEQGGALNVIDSTKRIVCKANGSFYRALSREAGTKHGLNPTFCIYDELAQAKDRELYDTLNTAFGARDEPLFAVISTQSRDPQHILSELIDRGLDNSDPTVVCHLYAADDPDETDDDAPDDLFDEAKWYAANPALGDFLSIESVRKLAKQADESPSFEPSFRNLTLNQRVDSVPSVLTRKEWKACKGDGSGLIDGEEIYIGLDLSLTTDLCAAVAVSAHGGSRLAAWFWKPEKMVDLHSKRDRVPYERWAKEGHLFLSPGRDVDYEIVAEFFGDLHAQYKILGVAFDRWRMAQLMKAFAAKAIPAYYADGDEENDIDGAIKFIEWGQGFKDMAPAVDALTKSVSARSLIHPSQPILNWCVSNAVVSMDPAGNRKLDKSKARFRIDGAVAMVMALGLKARDMPDEPDDIDDFLSNPLALSA